MKSMLFHSHTSVSSGYYQCLDCGRVVSMEAGERLPRCPNADNVPHLYRVWFRVSREPEKEFISEHSRRMDMLFPEQAIRIMDDRRDCGL